MIWIALFVAALAGYIIGALRTFAFCGYWCERIGMAFVTMQPRCGGWWRGERVFFPKSAGRVPPE